MAPSLGGSSNGRTTGSGPVNLGSNPSPPASLPTLRPSSRLSPLRPRRLAEHLPVAGREVRRRHEAGGAGDAHDRQVGLVDQVARPLEAGFEVELRRRAAEVAAEEALELAA